VPLESLTSAPTAAGEITREGTILGTLSYMAPEQLEGKPTDARADIFALGAVLYEMATGKKAFTGESQASLIAAILEHEPDPIISIRPIAPAALDRVVKACLAKDLEDRWQAAGDVGKELKWIAEGSPAFAGVVAAAPTRRAGRELAAWALAAVSLLSASLALLIPRPRSPQPVVQTSVLPPEKASFSFGDGPMALSPDGRSVAFVAEADGKKTLWVRPLGVLAAQSLAGTEGAAFPFWSPDGRFLAFFADGKLKRIDFSGGSPQTLSEAAPSGGAWSRDGTILFTLRSREGLVRLPAAGGVTTPVTTTEGQELSHNLPCFLPDGRSFLYQARFFGYAEVRVGSLDGKARKVLFRATSGALYLPPGYLIFSRGRTLLAQAFDARRHDVRGEALSVADQIQDFPNSGFAAFSASLSGLLAYQSDTGGGLSRLVWFDRAGKQLETVAGPASYLHPRLSHDGRRLAVDVVDPRTSRADIWIHDLEKRVAMRLTLGPGDNTFPVWSPDDSRIAFASNRSHQGDLYVKASSGAGSDEVLLSQTDLKSPSDWSADGRYLGFSMIPSETKTRQPLFQTNMPVIPFSKYDASPDGQRFLVNTLVGEPKSNPITLVQNWTADLAR
jgi:Tol biopolymer transport system component